MNRTNLTTKISVIIPVYNVEAYLEECLNSLVTQTLQEIEIICVDDGSQDSSLQIIKDFAQKDKRVFALSQENQGVSVARNFGLSRAIGTYVYFMDSDDYLESKESLEIIYETMSQDDLEVLSFNYRTIGFEEKHYKLSMTSNVLMDGKACLRENGRGNVMPWLRCMRRDYLKSIDFKFIPGIAAEDDEALPRIYYDAKRVKHIDEILIVYRQRENSITKSKLSMKQIRGLGACSRTYFELSHREKSSRFRTYLYGFGLDYLFLMYLNTYAVDDLKVAQEHYQSFISECSFNTFERWLIGNEEQYIYYHDIEHKNKKDRLAVYYIRRIRIIYFKYLWHYFH